MERRAISPWPWGAYAGIVQANEVTNPTSFLVCSGQAAVDEQMQTMYPGDMGRQITQAIDNAEAVLTAAGYTWADVIQINVFTTDVPLYLQHFYLAKARFADAGYWAAGTLLGVAALSAPDMLVQYQVMAVK